MIAISLHLEGLDEIFRGAGCPLALLSSLSLLFIIIFSVILKTPFQVNGFTVQGRVVDNLGNGIAEATIVAHADATDEHRSSVSGPDGRYGSLDTL